MKSGNRYNHEKSRATLSIEAQSSQELRAADVKDDVIQMLKKIVKCPDFQETKAVMMSFDLFVKERNAALLSLDEKRIKSVMKKYGLWIPPSEEGFWRGVHKAICNITEFPPEVRKKSADWLLEHSSTPENFGKAQEGGTTDA